MTTNPRQANGSRRRNVVARVLARDDHCWLCKQPVDKTLRGTTNLGAPEIHEIIPVSRGGSPYTLANCTLTHRRCNQWIGNRTPAELATGRRQGKIRPGPILPVQTSRAW